MKLKLSIITGIFLFIFKQSMSQNMVWTKHMSNYSYAISSTGNKSEAQGFAVATDAAGNVYSAGSIVHDTVDFDPGPGIFHLSTQDDGFCSYISKLDAAGNFLWAKKIGGNTSGDKVMCYSMTVTSSGNIYLAGFFYGTIDVDPGVIVHNLTAQLISGDVFVIKLDSSGTFLWASQIGGLTLYDNISVYSIAKDNEENLLITGSFSGTIDFDPGVNAYNLTAGVRDIFITKLDSAGNLVWAKQMNGSGMNCEAYSYDLSTDRNGNVYGLHYIHGIFDFDPGMSTYILSDTGDFAGVTISHSTVISKLDSSGNFVWARQFICDTTSGSIGMGKSWGFSIEVSFSAQVYVTGTFGGDIDVDPGAGVFRLSSNDSYSDIYVVRLDSSGMLIWAKSLNGTSIESTRAIETDQSEDIYLAGWFRDTIDIDPGPGINELYSGFGISDGFILKLDSSGNFIRVAEFDLTSNNIGSTMGVNSIHIDSVGNIYTTGSWEDTADFDPGPASLQLTTIGYRDIYVSMFSQSSTKIQEAIRNEFELSVYPNPVSNTTTISFTLSKADKICLEVFDLTGRMVSNTNCKVYSAGQHLMNYDMKFLKAGIYLLKLGNENYSDAISISISD